MANKKLLTLDTEFPRSWDDSGPDGQALSCLTQPYISSLYLAIGEGGRNVAQLSVPYNKLDKFLKDLRESETVKDLCVAKLGSFLDESDLDLINS